MWHWRKMKWACSDRVWLSSSLSDRNHHNRDRRVYLWEQRVRTLTPAVQCWVVIARLIGSLFAVRAFSLMSASCQLMSIKTNMKHFFLSIQLSSAGEKHNVAHSVWTMDIVTVTVVSSNQATWWMCSVQHTLLITKNITLPLTPWQLCNYQNGSKRKCIYCWE